MQPVISIPNRYRDHHSTGSGGAAHRTGQSADDLLPMISGLYRTWQSRKPRERLVWTNLPMKGYKAESERIRCHRAALISNWRKQGSIRRKEEASYIGDNIGKCNHRITGLCSRRKHLFHRADRSSRIISLPERDQKRGQEQIRKKNADKIIWIGGERGSR